MVLTERVTIYIPHEHITSCAVKGHIGNLTSECGGCTYEDARGSWVDGSGLITEHIVKITWWYELQAQMHLDIDTLILHLLQEGEQAVMVEYKEHACIVTLDEEGALTW